MSRTMLDARSFGLENNGTNFNGLQTTDRRSQATKNEKGYVPALTHLLKQPSKSVGRYLHSIGTDPQGVVNILDLFGFKFSAELYFGKLGHHPIEFLKQSFWLYAYLKGPEMLKRPLLLSWLILQTFGLLTYYTSPILLAL